MEASEAEELRCGAARGASSLDDPEYARLLVNALDCAGTGIAVIRGPELGFELANAAYRALTPRPEVDPVGRRYREVWPGGEEAMGPLLHHVLDTGEPFFIGDHAFSGGGPLRRFSLHLKAVPWRGATGALVVQCETTAMWEARRQQAEREDLVRMVSHDLRSPLNAILAQAHLLRQADPARVEERAHSIVRSCDRMRSMIQDLLEVTLLEVGQLRMSPTELDLAAFVREVMERHRGALEVERVRVDASEQIPARADPERLERVLVNLVSNALKYSPNQGEVGVGVERADGGVLLAVRDRGIGIAPEDLPHVFERFFRARGSRQPEGLGLGLYISRLLVHAHGGRIDVETQLGCGSTFRVFLPAASPAPPQPAG